MKDIIINNKIIIILIVLIIFVTGYNDYKYQKQYDSVKQELLKAQEPSLVEVQKEELTTLERSWQKKEMSIEAFEEKLEEIRAEKIALEPLIQEKRREMLGISK